jgi:hypothetical protein
VVRGSKPLKPFAEPFIAHRPALTVHRFAFCPLPFALSPMPSDSEQIAAIKSQVLQILVEITANPKPTYDIDGQSVSWNAYLLRLQGIVEWCDRKLAAYGPFEIESRATTA